MKNSVTVMQPNITTITTTTAINNNNDNKAMKYVLATLAN